MRGQATGIRDGKTGEGAKDQRKQGERRTNTMQQGHQQGEHETPIQKAKKIHLAPREQHPPLSKINHFGFAKFLRVAIYNPNTQHI